MVGAAATGLGTGGIAAWLGASFFWKELGCCGVIGVAGVGVGGASASLAGVAAALLVFFLAGRYNRVSNVVQTTVERITHLLFFGVLLPFGISFVGSLWRWRSALCR